MLCDEGEMVGELAYIGDRENAGGGCETMIRFGWLLFVEIW